MSKIEEFEAIKKCLSIIVSTSPLYKNKKVFVFFIKNAKAGGLISKAKTNRYLNAFHDIAQQQKKKPVLAKAVDVSVMETQRARHAQVFTESIVDMAVSNKEDNEYLIVSAGGDGTSWEIQSVLMTQSLKNKKTQTVLKEKVSFLALALGTGNDGADGKTLEESLSFLTEGKAFTYKKAVMIQTSKDMPEFGSKTAFSFNIASVGIDAFVNEMTNKTKSFLPGNFYKLWVNISALFYETKYPLGPMEVKLYDKNNECFQSFNEPLLFCLLGASGKRTYGSGHKILPGEENFCMARQIPLHTKIQSLSAFKDGSHIGKPFTHLAFVSKMSIFYDRPVLLQIDGEVAALDKASFPLTMELVDFHVKKIIK